MLKYKYLKTRIDLSECVDFGDCLPEHHLERFGVVDESNSGIYDYIYEFNKPLIRQQIKDITSRLIDIDAVEWRFSSKQLTLNM